MTRAQNILFVVFDQLRADCVSGALAAAADLPNIRRFRAEAVSFDRHMSVVNPCGPSRASILTGQYAMNHRSVRNGTPLAQDTPNIAQCLRRAGYDPLLFGYTDTSPDPRQRAANDPALRSYEQPMEGFNEVLEMRFEESLPWRAHLMAQGYDLGSPEAVSALYVPLAQDSSASPRPSDPARYAAKDSDTAFLTDQLLAYLASRRACPPVGQLETGWCAHVTYIRPHPPLVAPAPYNRAVDPASVPPPHRPQDRESAATLHPFCAPAQDALRARDMVSGQPGLGDDPETVAELRAVYLGLAREVDHHFGRLIEALKASGDYDNTLIVMTADHGEMLGDHHQWGKMSFYDAAYHTPLSIRLPAHPQSQAGRAWQLPTELVDVMATILDCLGCDIPNSVDGRSLLPLLQGHAPTDWRCGSFSELDFGDPLTPTPWQQRLGLETSASNLAIWREGALRLVVFAAAKLPPLLFDLDGPGEGVNVATDPAYAERLGDMMQAMLRHRMRNMNYTLSHDAITPKGPRRAIRQARTSPVTCG